MNQTVWVRKPAPHSPAASCRRLTACQSRYGLRESASEALGWRVKIQNISALFCYMTIHDMQTLKHIAMHFSPNFKFLLNLSGLFVSHSQSSPDAKASHPAWQGSVSIAAIVSIKSGWVVVLRLSGSIPIPVAVAAVGFWVPIVQVSGLRRGWKLRLRSV